jgi:hypothetical protein
MKSLATLTATLLMTVSAAWATITPDTVIADFTAQGFTRVEVKTGPTQTKVEAIRGLDKVEVVYDTATGTILSRETETVDAGDDTAPGFEIRNRDRDFIRVADGRPSDDDDFDDDHDDSDGRDDSDDRDDRDDGDDGDDRDDSDDDRDDD